MLKLFIRDNTDGAIHEYGTNSHDSLILQKDGSLHYYNMGNGSETKYPDDEGYTFVRGDGVKSVFTLSRNSIQNGVSCCKERHFVV